ncbi:hypothetical protein HQ865_20245 [Mucilaginibacter mali]|uniref:MalT-like TPR region domain-containing protein n=1 Tax=Mucilaginibacter mali TaxID=2740462 RepID=A0A7D4UGL7_9SPHI|nr:hypothetical protein [Mucilaginibacter mali]QKJ31996.1 hypothetical protein HQ865_20245 [Mucilaginibacter mali]
MRITLIVLFCSISLTASAQWWRLKKLPEHPPAIEAAQHVSPQNFLVTKTPRPVIKTQVLSPGDYRLEVMEAEVMRTAQHNMRFRIYDVASVNFSDLAQLYVKQNRYSEAKWYFLQSTFLARQQNNNRLTISNLCKLAMVKLEIGDFILAQQDLLEAREIAASHGWLTELLETEKQLSAIQYSRFATLKGNIRYAELAAQD